jgi:hypothetical protein
MTSVVFLWQEKIVELGKPRPLRANLHLLTVTVNRGKPTVNTMKLSYAAMNKAGTAKRTLLTPSNAIEVKSAEKFAELSKTLRGLSWNGPEGTSPAAPEDD